MKCRSCGASLVVQKLNGEIALHFPGLDGLNKPIVFVFPQVLVCLQCGFAEFAVPDEPLATIKEITTQGSRGASA
jgi:hypothetical protein